MIFHFLNKQISEIYTQKFLVFYGAILALLHVLTAFFWRNSASQLSTGTHCWSFFSDCDFYSSLIHFEFKLTLLFYAGLALLAAVLFCLNKVKLAFYSLLLVTLFKALIQISDYRYMGNYHYMHHVICIVFLFFPAKSNSIKLFITLFYFFAGLLKFNADWLSGAALLREVPWVSKEIMSWLLFSVLYIELVLNWFLLSKQKILFYFSLFIFFSFHVFSYFVVGYFYPLVMLGLLSIFIFQRPNFEFPRSKFIALALFIFTIMNIYPLVFEPNSALHGRGRLLSLNMLDAKAVCSTTFFIKRDKKIIEYSPPTFALSPRGRCDHTTLFNLIKNTCKDQQGDDFIDMDIDHQIKRATDSNFSEQVTFQNVCSNPVKIDWMGRIWQE